MWSFWSLRSPIQNFFYLSDRGRSDSQMIADGISRRSYRSQRFMWERAKHIYCTTVAALRFYTLTVPCPSHWIVLRLIFPQNEMRIFHWIIHVSMSRMLCCRSGLPTRGLCALACAGLLFVAYAAITLQSFDRYTGNLPYRSQGICRNRTARETELLLEMAYKVHGILKKMEIQHWLIYGSVFGALRRDNAPQPWDEDVDFGMDGDGALSTIDLSEFQESFREAGLDVIDGWSNSHAFNIVSRNPELRGFKVDLVAFYRYGKWMKRRGWGPWLMFMNFNRYHTFPVRLAEPPLPTMRFGPGNLPVLRGGMEVQKHIYPNDWWKVVKPACMSEQWFLHSLWELIAQLVLLWVIEASEGLLTKTTSNWLSVRTSQHPRKCNPWPSIWPAKKLGGERAKAASRKLLSQFHM